jgi:dephospho-CoA kinase
VKVVMIVGKTCAGKDTVAELMRQRLYRPKAPIISFSDPIGEVLDIFNLPPTRQEFSDMAATLARTSYGQSIFCRGIEKTLAAISRKQEIVFVCGVRFLADLALRKRFSTYLLGVEAPVRVRFERARVTMKDGSITFSQFLRADRASTEGDIDTIMEQTDMVILNNGTIDELREQCSKAITKFQLRF